MMSLLTAQEIEVIRKRVEKATEGPWRDNFGSFVDGIEVWSDEGCILSTEGGIVRYPDAEFIANAREDIPKLLAEVEALRNALKPDDTTIIATNQRLQADLKEAESIALWSARRLPQTYKSFAYDAIDELFGGKAERL